MSSTTSYARHAFVPLALLGLPAARILSAVRPRYAGIELGLNVPYSFGTNSMSADEVLTHCVQFGVGALGLRLQLEARCARISLDSTQA